MVDGWVRISLVFALDQTYKILHGTLKCNHCTSLHIFCFFLLLVRTVRNFFDHIFNKQVDRRRGIIVSSLTGGLLQQLLLDRRTHQNKNLSRGKLIVKFFLKGKKMTSQQSRFFRFTRSPSEFNIVLSLKGKIQSPQLKLPYRVCWNFIYFFNHVTIFCY